MSNTSFSTREGHFFNRETSSSPFFVVLSLHTLYGINDWLVGAGLRSHSLVCFAIADIEPSTLFIIVLHLMHFRLTVFLPLPNSATNFEDFEVLTCPVFSLQNSVMNNGASSTSPTPTGSPIFKI